MIDYYSKWPEVHFCQRATTKDVLNYLHEVFSREGYPTEVVTDNGRLFITLSPMGKLNVSIEYSWISYKQQLLDTFQRRIRLCSSS
uniref:Integrase catalytic domain-containing protein n=1 Tax=Trichuris muris TaxID=70415 RepID=A0A5S6QPY8_TRIMR